MSGSEHRPAPPARRITQDNILATFHEAAALQDSGRHAEAVELWRLITAAAPMSGEAFVNLSSSLLEQAQTTEAEAALRRALALAPDAPWAQRQLARQLYAVGRWAEAEAPLRAALAGRPGNPSLQVELAKLLLGLGRFEEGWPLYEARVDAPGQNAERLPLPNRWTGEPLAGKSLLVWPEQGFGDQMQFARFAPALARQGARVTVVAPPELTALFHTLGDGVDVLERSADLTLPEPDYWTLPMSIPAGIGLTLDAIPSAPYLSAPTDRRAKWSGHAGQGAIGVVWTCRGPPNPYRALPSKDLLAPLEALGRPLIDLSEPIGDFADAAAVIEQLDVLVSVDTAHAHLAGALGKPVILILPAFRPDWRWLQGRTDSPWYPTMQIVRQRVIGDWASVMEEVVSTIEKMRLAMASGI